jgi:two-component system chemotaxis response regulator CheY
LERATTQESKPLRVLVVEDDDETRLMLREALTDEGFEVITAQDGLHALRTEAAASPDAIVLDFDLPLMSGPEVVQEWRSRRPHAHVPVIGMSALREGPAVARDLQLTTFLQKPFEIDTLISAIRSDTARAHA